MKKQTNRLLVLLGIFLLVVAAIVLLSWQRGTHKAQQDAARFVQIIRTLIPEPQGTVLEERIDNTMSVLSIEGKDFVGILEIPKFGSSLPICTHWGKISQYPCRLSGSVYDRTMQIGGTSQKGQYDFYGDISVGDSVFFTDMEGNRFSYEVTDIRYEKHADQAVLGQESAALTLFIKNIYSFEYIMIFCDSLR